MLNERTDEVWARLKELASAYARSDRPLPTEEQCASELERILRDVYGADRIPSDAFDFYAAELCAMIEDERRNLTSLSS